MRNALLLLAACALLPHSAAAQMRPHARWQQLQTQHFTVVFEPGLDSIAQHAGQRAEAAFARLAAELSTPPKHRIEIVIGDNLDFSNGAATPLPANRIYLWARPPADDVALGYYNDWMDLLIAHELTHIFHLDRAGAVGRALRFMLGRVPFGWPFFPVLGTPRWTTEGLATYRESVHTGAGRVYGTYHDMILRTAVLEADFEPIDRVSGETPTWPAGQRAYIYGSLFMDYIADRLGAQAHRQLLDKTAGSVLPPPWVMNSIAKRATGKSFTRLYDEWRRDLEQRYRVRAEAISAHGLTPSERVAGGERVAWYPRVSPDGKRIAYAEEDGRHTAMTVVLDLATGERRRTRRNGIGLLAWANNSTIVTTQPEFSDPYTLYSDLYYQHADGQQRLTRGARYDAVDADRSGRKLLVVANAGGLTSLVEHHAHTGRDRVIVEGRPDVQWVSARWSPDGARIAAQRWQLGGRHDVVVLDTLGLPLTTRPQPWVYDERATDGAPTWSPDGRWVVFTSDRGGVNNVFAFDPENATGLVFQLTNVLTGVFFPEVSPDGTWLYYSAYHADGFTIERTRFEPNAWWPVTYQAAGDTVPVVIPPQADSASPTRSYSAVRSAMPRFWLPIFAHDSIQGTFVGAFTAGADAVSRHNYAAALAYNFGNGRTLGWLGYTYAGLGNPLLTLNASREYDILAGQSVRREDNLSLRATLLRPRWRSNVAFTLGIEGVVIRRDSSERVLDVEDRLIGAVAGVAFGNARTPTYAISAEDGLRVSLAARRRFDTEPVFRDATYTELFGVAQGYRSISAFGFAHHVLAARVSGVQRTGLGIGPTDVGGTGDFLPVRGFEDGDRIGFSAWSASLEYRLPVAMIGRGVQLWPLFVDRMGASIFADAGNARCTAAQAALYLFCPGNEDRARQLLLSAGLEFYSDIAVLSFIPVWVRAGVAQPIQGPRDTPRFYVTLGQSF